MRDLGRHFGVSLRSCGGRPLVTVSAIDVPDRRSEETFREGDEVDKSNQIYGRLRER